jgi:hypothetical protein
LRRELRSAERLSEAAIRFGSRKVKTPRLRSRASLSFVTRCDHRFDEDRVAVAFRRFFAAVLLVRPAGRREVADLRLWVMSEVLVPRAKRA